MSYNLHSPHATIRGEHSYGVRMLLPNVLSSMQACHSNNHKCGVQEQHLTSTLPAFALFWCLVFHVRKVCKRCNIFRTEGVCLPRHCHQNLAQQPGCVASVSVTLLLHYSCKSTKHCDRVAHVVAEVLVRHLSCPVRCCTVVCLSSVMLSMRQQGRSIPCRAGTPTLLA